VNDAYALVIVVIVVVVDLVYLIFFIFLQRIFLIPYAEICMCQTQIIFIKRYKKRDTRNQDSG